MTGDLWPIKPLFEEMGIEVISTLTGDERVEAAQRVHLARLDLVQCNGSVTHLAKVLEEMYGTPYRRISFFGLENMCLALRSSAEFFGIQKTAEEIILRETAMVRQEIEKYRSMVDGRRAATYMGGAAKAIALVRASEELGMDVVIIGTRTEDAKDYRNIS